nr:MAG TPA: hypothetical protein [Caudoviricetes sp.]
MVLRQSRNKLYYFPVIYLMLILNLFLLITQ